jgi:hypothetical protein
MELGKQLEGNLNIRNVLEIERENRGKGEEDEISRTLSATPIYAVMVLLYNSIHLSPSIQIIATD